MKPTDIRPPFDEETAKAKVKAAEDAWNTRNPELVAKAYRLLIPVGEIELNFLKEEKQL